MARQFRYLDSLKDVKLLPAAADAAGRTSSYVSLRNALKAWVVADVNQGNAAQVTFSPLQAQDSAGTGSKAIPVSAIFANQDTSTATGSDAFAAQTAAATFQTSAATKDKTVVFELDLSSFDVANAFEHIALQTSASNAGNITSAKLVILPRYPSDVASQPTAFV
jgi:hypothetical protein